METRNRLYNIRRPFNRFFCMGRRFGFSNKRKRLIKSNELSKIPVIPDPIYPKLRSGCRNLVYEICSGSFGKGPLTEAVSCKG